MTTPPRGVVVIVKTDLSEVRIIGDGPARAWTPQGGPEGAVPTAREARARAAAAATWISRDTEARKRIDAICADVDEALCVWMRSPSAARPVVASQLRTMAQEWGDEASVLGVEPVREDVPASARPTGRWRLPRRTGSEQDEEPIEAAPEVAQAPGFGVVALPDAMLRLLADSIDAAGVRVGSISTVWHLLAMASRADAAPGVTGVLVIDPANPRLVWSWADETGLIAGGSVRLGPDSIDDSARRLALDWLTWASQIGLCPDQLVILGPDSKAWSAAIAQSWQAVPTTTEDSDDPLALAARKAGAATAAPISGRWCLARVTRRPTRATRARHKLVGAALVLLLIAVSSVAFRLKHKANEWKAESASIRQQMAQIVREAWPEKSATQPMGNPRKVAETLFDEERNNFKPFQAPPRPRPIFEEATRVATILASHLAESPEGAEPSILLTVLSLDQERGNMLSFMAPERQLASELIVELNTNSRFMVWERKPTSTAPREPHLTGEWTKETE